MRTFGRVCCKSMAFWPVMTRSLQASDQVLTYIYCSSSPLKHHQITLHLLNIGQPLTLSLSENLPQGTMSDLSRARVYTLSSETFKPPLYQSFQSLESPANIASFKFFPFPIRLLLQLLLFPLTLVWTLMTFLELGVRSILFVPAFGISHQDLKQQLEMLLKLTIQFLCYLHSGQLRSFILTMMPFVSTHARRLVWGPLLEPTVMWLMPVQTCYERLDSVRSRNGWTTIFSFALNVSISLVTIRTVTLYILLYYLVPFISPEVDFGLKVPSLKTVPPKFSEKIVDSQYQISHAHCLALIPIVVSLLTLVTSTTPLSIWESPGNPKKTRLSHMKSSSLVFFGTLLSLPLRWQTQRRQSILRLLLPGSHSRRTCSLKYNASMGSCFTPASWCPMDVPTSPPWNQCSVSPVRVLSCHITPSATLSMIFPGGLHSSPNPRSINPFPSPSASSTRMLIPTPALASESQLLSMGFGALGPCYQDGALSVERKTLGGLKPSDSSCSSIASFGLESPPPVSTFVSTVTTLELSMGGRMDGVETGPRTMSFVGSSLCSNLSALIPRSTYHIFPVVTTQQTLPPEEDSHRTPPSPH